MKGEKESGHEEVNERNDESNALATEENATEEKEKEEGTEETQEVCEKEDAATEAIPLGVVKSASTVVLTEKEKQFAETYVIECSARRSIVHRAFMTSLHLSPPPLVAGRSILAHVFAIDPIAKAVVLKITHFSYALLPFTRAFKDPNSASLKNVERQFPIGQSVRVL